MMSMFSSFDALCQKLSFSMGHSSKPLVPMKNNGEEGNSNSTTPGQISKAPLQQPRSQQRNPRFAPELDGVHCFETIVPY